MSVSKWSQRPRRFVTAPQILDHYGIGRDAEPFCFGCEAPAGYWNNLDCAHLVAHARHGLDAPQNLVILCPRCNGQMPLFVAGEEEAARAWVLSRRRWQVTVDARPSTAAIWDRRKANGLVPDVKRWAKETGRL